MSTLKEYLDSELLRGKKEFKQALNTADSMTYGRRTFTDLMSDLKPKLEQGLPARIVSGDYGKGYQLIALQTARAELVFKQWLVVEMYYTFDLCKFVLDTMVRDPELLPLYRQVIAAIESAISEETEALSDELAIVINYKSNK